MLNAAPEIGDQNRARARSIVNEVRWLEQLQRAYDGWLLEPSEAVWCLPPENIRSEPLENIRLDLIAAEVVEAIGLSGTVRIDLRAEAVTAYASRLAVWRVLSNVLGNAVRAAGPSGAVGVHITVGSRWAVADIDDNGPGFGAGPPGLEALGLSIARELAAEWGGGLEVGRSRLGGSRVRLRIPVRAPLRPPLAYGRAA
ncbi:hypothetical protein Raf01_50110 [Rugosimonospora africana]|uniref:Histidine kinase domain-containing protein n=2 Tax=Rugosimonospora africana TaxID=556532 RepID=A0A8J3VS93_9ACTN|nr:hypothetical protein Raf01_50110 [Rugosimonospora africana]